MHAALYCRKSTDQHVTDEQKSVARQIEHARAYATRHGWTVTDAHVFVDDGISGAEFAARPGFVRLMTALKPRAPFSALIMSEASRLGREQFETGYALKQLSQAGVKVFSYLDDREIALDNATDKFMASVGAFASEIEREKAKQRVIDVMTRKAKSGHCVGGRAFGYDNVEILGSDGRRSHVERVVNPEEAAIVVRIFELSASGTGFTRIARLLNEEGAPCPRPMLRPDGRRRPAGWAPTSVRAILLRPLYRGTLLYNTTKKKDEWGQHKISDRPEREWIRSEVPALRVVSEDLWQAAQTRLAGIQHYLATVVHRPTGRRRDIESAYLLAGFTRCASCGNALCVMNRTVIGCISHHKRGARVCANALRLPMERVNEAVLTKLRERVRPRVVLAIVDELFEQLTPQARSADLEQARAALRTLEREIGNLTRAIAMGGDLESLVGELRSREARRRELLAVTAAGDTVRTYDRKAIDQRVRVGLAAWQTLLGSTQVADGRQFLREALEGPLLFTPDGRQYRFEGHTRLDRLIVGAVGDGVQPLWCARGELLQVARTTFSGIAA